MKWKDHVDWSAVLLRYRTFYLTCKNVNGFKHECTSVNAFKTVLGVSMHLMANFPSLSSPAHQNKTQNKTKQNKTKQNKKHI